MHIDQIIVIIDDRLRCSIAVPFGIRYSAGTGNTFGVSSDLAAEYEQAGQSVENDTCYKYYCYRIGERRKRNG